MYYINRSFDICGLMMMTVILFGVVFGFKEKSRKNKLFLALVITQTVYFVIDLTSYNLLLRIPDSLLTYHMGYLLAPVSILWYAILVGYLVSILREKNVGSWKLANIAGFYALINIAVATVSFIQGNLYYYHNSDYKPGTMYFALYASGALLLIYYGAICLYYRKELGFRNTVALIIYMVLPFVTGLVDIYIENGFQPFTQAICILICFSFVQHDNMVRAEYEKNRVLTETKDEMEGQLEEISALNVQLQDNQTSLEEFASEQEAQIEEITALNEELQEARDNFSRAYGMIVGLSHEYHTIWVVDKDTLDMRLVRSSGVSTIKSAIQRALDASNYEVASKEYVDRYVEPEDRERVRREVRLETIFDQLSKSDFYYVNYLRRDDNDNVGYHQMAFANADAVEGARQFVFGFRDIDKMIKEEQELKRQLTEAKQAAERASNAKTKFLFNMSHDIRTPMNAIMGFTDLLEKYSGDQVKTNYYLDKIRHASDFLLLLINDVLEVARIESGKVTLDNTISKSGDISKGLFAVFSEQMQEKNIKFTINIDVKTKYIYVDKTKTNEILLNLLSNAFKYTPKGGSVSMTVKEVPYDQEGMTLFETTVKDTGIGISKEFLPLLFDEFSREKTVTENGIEGTGLGMPIVKRLVTLMGGTIDVESELGKGTKFVVRLPHKIGSEEFFAKSEDVKIDKTNFKGRRILMAEDNDMNAEIAIELLEDAGFKVERAEDGIICFDMLQKADSDYYDLILMDVQMPNMNGYKATQIIRTMDDPKKSSIPIIAMTANAFEEDKRDALNAGMNAHLAKPIRVAELMEALENELG